MQENPTNYFQELKVFEDNKVNILCDEITTIVNNILNEELTVCGSVAKMLGNRLNDEYTPKDIDFKVSFRTFRLLRKEMFLLKNVVMIEESPVRFILYTEYNFCIEIWNTLPKLKYEPKQYYKGKIPYLILITPWQNK